MSLSSPNLSSPNLGPNLGRARPEQALPGAISPGLLRGRVHELCGPARVTLALMILQLGDGPVIWITPSWLPERPYSCGIHSFLHPGRLIFARARRPEDIQWAGEEALRSGAAPVVVMEMPAPPGLTPVRRLHLAAETGREAAHHAARPTPLGLILTPGDGGAQGVESRWHLSAIPARSGLLDDEAGRWHIARRRARTAPIADWALYRESNGKITALPCAPAS